LQHQLLWIIFGIVVIGIMALDLGLFQKFLYKKHHETMTMKDALFKTILYVLIALGFNAVVWVREGHEHGMQFLAGYLIELSLSVDNLFVFLLLFSYFKVPVKLQNRVLFWGIFGALLMRALFIFIGSALLERFHWIIYVFGAFLVLTSIKMFFQKEHEADPETNFVVKLLRKIFRVTHDYRNDHFFVKENHQFWVTPLFIVLVLVETTDIIFALIRSLRFSPSPKTHLLFLHPMFSQLWVYERSIFALQISWIDLFTLNRHFVLFWPSSE
jgi:tellurite resistance protein TerC